jgi:CelD/BcsL family acetyltransferase involved in cellulose biosynthesis
MPTMAQVTLPSTFAERFSEVEIVSSFEGLLALAPEWRELERRSVERFGYFQSCDWCLAWARQYMTGPRPVAEPRVLVVRRAGRMVLLWPAMVAGGPLGTRVLQSLGAPHTQYAAALADPALADEEAVQLIVDGLRAREIADVADIQLVPAASLLARALSQIALPSPEANETALLRLDAYPTWEAYLASQPTSQRRKRRERSKRMARHGAIGFDVIWPSDPTHAGLVATAVAWKRRWLEETGRISQGVSMDGFDTFLTGLPGDAERREGAVAFRLTIDGVPVALELGMIEAGHYYAYLGSFDWEQRALSRYPPVKY